VRYYFDQWGGVPDGCTENLLARILKNQVGQERKNNERLPSTGLCIVDA